jgi:hypothetical protein
VTTEDSLPDCGVPLGATRNTLIAVAGRPRLWGTAVAAVVRLAAPGWWRRPTLPLPDPRLWELRMITMYGRPDAEPSPPDVVSYLEWCRSTRPDRRGIGSRPPRRDHRPKRRCG